MFGVGKVVGVGPVELISWVGTRRAVLEFSRLGEEFSELIVVVTKGDVLGRESVENELDFGVRRALRGELGERKSSRVSWRPQERDEGSKLTSLCMASILVFASSTISLAASSFDLLACSTAFLALFNLFSRSSTRPNSSVSSAPS